VIGLDVLLFVSGAATPSRHQGPAKATARLFGIAERITSPAAG